MSDPVTTAKLMEDLQAVVRDAEALLHATATHTGERIDAVRKQTQDSVSHAKARLSHKLGAFEDEALQDVRDAAAATKDYVKKNPLQSLGIAAGIGLVLGLLLRNRD